MKYSYQTNRLLKYLIINIILFSNLLLAKPLNFTQEELTYINQNKTLTIAMVDTFKPFSFVYKNEHQGLSVDIIKKISLLSGLKFQMQTSSWSQALKKFKEKKVDMISGISHTKEREEYTLFTESFYQIPTYVFGLKNNKLYKNNKSLKGKRVGVNRNMFYMNSLEEQGIQVIEYKNSDEKVKALAFDEIDYFLANYTTGLEAISSNVLTNIKPLDEYTNIKKEDIRYGINKEDKTLHNIIEKSLKYINKKDIQLLRNRWIHEIKEIEGIEYKLNLTKNEKLYLKKKHIIKMCNNQKVEPLEFAYNENQNDMRGISIDTLHIIEKQLNIKFENVATKDWEESQEFLKEKKCDILPASIKNEERLEYANFTKAYLHFPLAILTHRDKGFVPSLESIINEKMVHISGSEIISKLKNKYPNINIIETKSRREAFKHLSDSKAYFTIDIIPTVSNIMSKYIIKDLHIAGYTGIIYHLGIAVRNDDLTLLNILNKSLNTINKKDHDNIYRKWVTPVIKEKVNSVDYGLVYKTILISFFLIIIILFWNKRIRKEKEKIDHLYNDLKDKEVKLKNANKQLELLSSMDKLTNIYNRRKIDEILTKEFERSSRTGDVFSLAMVDVDYFKSVNDNYGHQVGDEVISNIAKLIKDSIRKVDTVGRWGGEEFLIISPYTQNYGMNISVEKIRRNIQEHHFDKVGERTVSIGVANYQKGDTVDSLLKRADDALYQAKRSGRNRVVFD
jgi:polar amino acid transport system substrate-binding protein